MRFVIYKITNLINGKYYIGRHATSKIDDNYMGSGVAIKNAIAKHGIENFKKEILAETHSREELWQLEKEIVNDVIVKDPMSYNMAYGGKHYLDGLKKYDIEAFVKHQSDAGKLGGKAAISTKDSAWHAKGGSVSSRKRAALYKYVLTTSDGVVYNLDGNTLKALCKEKGWNYDTLMWTRHKDRPVMAGPLKGFRLDQVDKPVSKILKGK